MPESKANDQAPEDDDSLSFLRRLIRRFFDLERGNQSLRAQLEETIDEHESEQLERESHSNDDDLSPTEVTMLRNILHFSERNADDIAIPRGEIIAVPARASWPELVDIFAQHGHSRMPVYQDTLDQVIGMIHIKDLFANLAHGTPPPDGWLGLMRQPLYVPQSRTALDVLADMRTHRTHLAIVLDEYSGVDGIITIEDLVEEIVGDIEDEHDEQAPEMLVQLDGGLWDADARAGLDEVARQIDPQLGTERAEIDTLGGLTYMLAGQVPPIGTIVTHGSGWRIEITGGDERHVTRLRLHPPVSDSDNANRQDIQE